MDEPNYVARFNIDLNVMLSKLLVELQTSCYMVVAGVSYIRET